LEQVYSPSSFSSRARKTEIDGRFCENHHFIWHLGPSCVAKRSREHVKREHVVCLMPTLVRDAPWSRCTVRLRSLREHERPRSTGGSVKITTLFGTSVAPALPNDHENTFEASMAFVSCSHLSGMRLGAGVQSVFVLVDSANDRDRRAVL